MISRARIKPAENDQDDWIRIEFGSPTLLVSPFVVRQEDDDK
ncbi:MULTISPECIES: hypothetical protein [unclassified Bradyrhizobium]